VSLRAAALAGGTGGATGAPFSGYITGNWYKPYLDYGGVNGATGSNAALFLALLYMPADVVITALGSRVTTAGAGNVMLGIYAHNAITGLPTGNVLASVTGLSTTSTGNVSATLGANVPLARGFYWSATETDNATAAMIVPSASPLNRYSVMGSPTQNEVNDGNYRGLSVVNTYGTFPDLTAASLVASTNDRAAMLNYRVA
jgi:hypothetical protein